MKMDYSNLWKLQIAKNSTKKVLTNLASLNSSTISKLYASVNTKTNI